MKNKKLILAAGLAAVPFIAGYSQAQQENMYKDILFSDEVKQQAVEDKAKNSAAQLLDRQPAALTVDIEQPERRSAEIGKAKEAYGQAPFGLVWGANKSETEALGVTLSPTELKDYVSAYEVQNLPNALDSFDKVIAVFGEDNRLWRVLAYGNAIEDTTPNAAKIMKIYDKYYNLLAQKYGNAQQNYTGTGTLQNNMKLQQELVNGTADVYATFEGNDIGAALAVNVEGNNKFYLVIDYRNLKILKENELKELQAL